MNMKRLLTLVAFFATVHATAQQVNPVPDYVFANRMSAGRNTVTDTAAYFSIGPRYGATRGMMPPMVVDTAAFSANKRNGLLIFSVQKNKFLYWDSVGVKWAEMAGTSGTALTSADTAALLSTRAWRQKGIDSLAAIRIAGSGTTNRSAKFTASATIGNGSIADSSSSVAMTIFSNQRLGVNTTTDAGYRLDVAGDLRTTTGARLATSSGLVGIGTTSAFYTLDVNGSTRVSADSWLATSTGNAGVGTTSVGSGTKFQVNGGYITVRGLSGGGGGYLTSWPNTTNASARTWAIGATVYTFGDFGINQSNAKDGDPISAGTTRLYISPSGNLGIGSNHYTPTRTLDVIGSISASDRITTSTRFLLLDSLAKIASEITPLGNMAIGNNIRFGGLDSALLVRNGAAVGILLGNEGVLRINTQTLSGTAGQLAVERFRINASGNVGIGWSPDSGYKLDINGSLRVRGDSGVFASNVKIMSIDSTATGQNILYADNNGIIKKARGPLTIQTGDPTGGTSKPWRLGEAATVSPTSPNRTIRVEIDGVVYYIHAKTTND